MGSDPAGDKVRFRFRKTGTLRLLSHHDLMRCTERMLRRADVPFRLTAGFHPTPRVVFALSLPLGVEGLNEVVEIELSRPLDPADLLDRLNRQAPDGLQFLSAKVVDLTACAVPRRAVYRLQLPPGRVADQAPAVADLVAAEKLWVDRTRPKPRRVNVRPYVRRVTVLPDAVEFDLWVTQNGSAKADELARLLGLGDVLDAGAVLERTDLEIHDEVTGAADAPPDGPPETAPLEHAPVGADDEANRPATWGLSPSGPVVE